MTDLIKAAEEGYLAFCKELIEAGADVDAKTEWGGTALMEASFYGHKEIVALLLKHGADINPKDYWGHTALTMASDGGHKDIVEMLEQAKGKAEVTDLIDDILHRNRLEFSIFNDFRSHQYYANIFIDPCKGERKKLFEDQYDSFEDMLVGVKEFLIEEDNKNRDVI